MGDVYMVNGKILSGLPNHAKDIIFDNNGTTLSSTNTEDAIKEVNSNLATDHSSQVTSSYTISSVTATKISNVVLLTFSIYDTVNIINNNATVLTLPSTITPSTNKLRTPGGWVTNDNAEPTGALFDILSNGSVVVKTDTGVGTHFVRGMVQYIL